MWLVGGRGNNSWLRGDGGGSSSSSSSTTRELCRNSGIRGADEEFQDLLLIFCNITHCCRGVHTILSILADDAGNNTVNQFQKLKSRRYKEGAVVKYLFSGAF